MRIGDPGSILILAVTSDKLVLSGVEGLVLSGVEGHVLSGVEGAYATSGGLHGVGVSVVNALSTDTVVEVARNRQLYPFLLG